MEECFYGAKWSVPVSDNLLEFVLLKNSIPVKRTCLHVTIGSPISKRGRTCIRNQLILQRNGIKDDRRGWSDWTDIGPLWSFLCVPFL